MKYKSLLVFSVLLAVIAAGCSKENASGNQPTGNEEVGDNDGKEGNGEGDGEGNGGEEGNGEGENNNPSSPQFTGTEVEVGENEGVNRLLILNEGPYLGQSYLDLLDFKTKTYSADVFGQANPDIVQGIGSTGNDIAMVGDRVWALMNASNQVVVMDKNDLKVVKTLDVESPRFITTDGTYAYITSYGAAVYGSPVSQDGWLYRVKLDSYDVSRVAVGPQPEGVAVHGDKVYVANSGGYNDIKDNRIMIVDRAGFNVEATFSLPASNLKMLFAAEDGLWVTTYDTYGPAPDYAFISAAGLYRVDYDGHNPAAVDGISPVYAMMVDDTVYSFGYGTLNKVQATDEVQTLSFTDPSLQSIYVAGACVNTANGDIIISSSSYTGNSSIVCVDKDLNYRWQTEAGIGAGHFLLY